MSDFVNGISNLDAFRSAVRNAGREGAMRSRVNAGSSARRFGAMLRRGRSGATALEFAIVSIPFLLFLLFLFEIGIDFYIQTALDYAVSAGARQIQVGNAQNAPTAALFKSKYLCPNIPGLLNCSAISVNVQPVQTDYYLQGLTGPPLTNGKLDTSQFVYCPGRADQLMLVQAVYTSTTIVGLLLPSMSVNTAAGRVRATYSSTGFVNERFPTGDAAGC